MSDGHLPDCPGYEVGMDHAPGCFGGRRCPETCPVPVQVECDCPRHTDDGGGDA